MQADKKAQTCDSARNSGEKEGRTCGIIYIYLFMLCGEFYFFILFFFYCFFSFRMNQNFVQREKLGKKNLNRIEPTSQAPKLLAL